MDASAEQTESCQGGRPYSPSDIMTYDISSDESDTKARIEFGPAVKTSSSSSDSSDDSVSSYEYHWQEAKPVKPPFEPFITSVNIGSTDLLAVKREYTTIVPLKVIFELQRLLPNGSSNTAFKIASKLGVHQLTKYEADLLTDHVNGLKTAILDDCDAHGDGGSTQFNRGDVACSYTSLKQKYVGLLHDLTTARNRNFGKRDQSCDRIGKRNNAAARISAPSNSAFVSRLGASDGDCDESNENRSFRNSSSSSKMCSVNENSCKKKAYHVVRDRIIHATVTEEVDNKLRLNRALSQPANCENKTGESPELKDRSDSCCTRNAVVLRHLYPENEDEDFDAEISRVLSIVRRKQNLKKTRGEPTKDLPGRIVENSDMKEHLSERSASNPSYVKPSQDSQTTGVKDSEKDGENDEICGLIHEKSAKELKTTTKTNWKALDNASGNSGVQRDAHEERIASKSVSTVGSPAIRIFWNTPKIASKSIVTSVFSDNDSSTTNAEAAAAPVPIPDETSFSAGSYTSYSHSPPATSCSSNQPEGVATIYQTGSESNDSVKLESEWAVTDSYICKSPDQYLTSSSRAVRATRGEYTTSNCDHHHNNLIHRPCSTERMDSSSITDANESDDSDSKHEKKNRRDMCQHPGRAEVLSSPSNSSSSGRKKGTFSPTESKKAKRKTLSSSASRNNIKERRRSILSQIHRNSRRRPDSTNRDGEASSRRNTARSKITKPSLRKRTTRERSRSTTSEKGMVNEKSSSNDNSGAVSSGVDAPKGESTVFKEDKRVSERNQVVSYQYSTNYSKLRYTYDSTIYSPISSDDADFGISDSCDEATSRTKTRKVLRRRSVRDSSRTSDDRSAERRKNIRDELPTLQSYKGAVRYPITRVDDGKEDKCSITVTRDLLLYNPSNSRLKANVENLVVSIRSQCDRDVSVVENRSKLPPRHVVVRCSPGRRRSSKQRIRRRSHSPSRLRSVSPVSFRRRGSERRRSLSPVRTRRSREKGSVGIDGAGISAKLFRRHKRDSTHPRIFNLTDNERSTDEVGNRRTSTHDPEMHYSSLQSSKLNCSQRNALSDVDGESVFHDKYHERHSAERSAFNGIKSVSNESRRDETARRREVRNRLDSSGLEPMAYDLLSPNGGKVDDDEIVIFKKRNPLDECWPFFFHKSDEGMTSEDENYDDEGCFMIGKLMTSLRNSQITTGIKKLQRTKRDDISNEEPYHANAHSVESTLINLGQPADLGKTADQKPSCDAVEYQLYVNVPVQSHDEEINRQELRNDATRNAEIGTSSVLGDIRNELPLTCSEYMPATLDGVSEEERCHAESCAIANTDATDRGSTDVLAPVNETSAIQCEDKTIGENLAIVSSLQSNCNTKDTAETSCESPAAKNFHAVACRQISPVVEVTAAVSSPGAYEEVAITGDYTVDKANAGLVGTSALQPGLNHTPSDSLNASVCKDEASSKLSNVPQQAIDGTSSPRSVEVESPNIFCVDQNGMCLGATITVEDDKLSRTTPRNVSNEPSGAKSWKKKLIEKAQNASTSNEENEGTSLNRNRNDATPSQDSFSGSRCLSAPIQFSRDDESVNIDKISGSPIPLPDKSLSSNLIYNRSSVLEEKCPDSPVDSNERNVTVDNQQEVSTKSDLLKVNQSHSIDSDGTKNGRKESAESSHPVGDHSTTEGFGAIKSGEKDSAAESADVASECNSVNIEAVVNDSVSVNAMGSGSSLDSTAEQIPQGDEGISIESVCQTDGTESKGIPEPETVTILPSENADAASVVESAINQNTSEENSVGVSLLSENAVDSSNIPSSTSESIYPPSEEKTLISTSVANQLESEMFTSSPKDTIESGSSKSSAEEPKEDNMTLLASTKLTDDSTSSSIVLEDCSRTSQDKTSPTLRCVPNAFKSVVVDPTTVSLSSTDALSHSIQLSSPVQNPPEYNQTLSSSAYVTGNLEKQNTIELTNSSEITTSRMNSLNDLCDSTSVAQTTVPSKDSCGISMADMGHEGEKLAGLDDSRSRTVPTTKVTGKETVPQINFSISGASGSLQSSSSTKIASCLSSSRIFAGPAASITIVNRPPAPVGLSNKSAFRGPSVESKLKQPKTILSKPWESFTKLQTANLPLSSSIQDAKSKRPVAASQHQNMGENYQPEKTSKPLKSILLNRNENPAFQNITKSAIASRKKPGEVISVSNSKASNEVTYAENLEIDDVIPDADIHKIRKYVPECSRKRKSEDESVKEISSKTKKSKVKRIVAKKSRSLPSCANEKVTAMPVEAEIGDGEFAEGDEVIGSLLPLIKTKAKRKAKKTGSSGRGRGRAKRRGRLPSISSDEDIIEELSAATQQPSSENNSNTQTENCTSKTEEDEDSDDGLVSFMGIIRSSDTVLPIVPDIKQEAESDHGEDEANIITDSESRPNDPESRPNDPESRPNDPETTENRPGKSENASKSNNDDVENIFAKLSREMEEMNESQSLYEGRLASSSFQDQDTTSNQSNIDNEISNLHGVSKHSKDEGAKDNKDINCERISDEPSHRNNEASESLYYNGYNRNSRAPDIYHNCNNRNSRATPLTTPDDISPNILTPPSSPKSDDNSKRATGCCSDPKTSKVQQDRKPIENFPTNSAKEAETTVLDSKMSNTVAKYATTICKATSNTAENNLFKSEEFATDTTNLIAAAAEMAGVPTSIPIVSPNTTQHIVANPSYTLIRDAKDNVLPSLKQKTSKAGIATKPLTNSDMPAGKSCHGFLEICLYGFDNPEKFTYALRRIPYVRTTPCVGENQNIGEEDGSELSSGASSTIATYLRVRDVICLLKVDVGRLHTLITRCTVQLFRPSDYTKDLFSTVYDPVGKSDPIIAKMTWRHALEDHVQEFLDHMIVLDKFLHSILPRFYVETLNIRTSDVPNFVNVKIFKPIFEINEEVVKIFRKPYEYNSVLIKKDCDIQSACVNKRNISNATLSAERSRRNKAAKPKEIGLQPQQQNRRGTTWNENATQNSLAALHTGTPITVPTLSPRFVGNGQSTNRLFTSLGYPAFADPRQFQNRQTVETKSLRSRVHHCDDRAGMARTTAVGLNTRLNETAYHAGMVRLSRMGTMISNESSEYIRRSTSILPLPKGLGVQNTISRFGMPFMPMHENHGQPIVNVNASSMAHPYVPLYSNTCRGVNYTHSGSQQPFSGNTVVSEMCNANNASEIQRPNAAELVAQPKSGPTQSGIDVLAEAAAAVCATDTDKAMPELKTGRNTRSGNQARRSLKVTKNVRSTVDRDDDNTQKPKKRKYQSTRTTRKSAREIKSKS